MTFPSVPAGPNAIWNTTALALGAAGLLALTAAPVTARSAHGATKRMTAKARPHHGKAHRRPHRVVHRVHRSAWRPPAHASSDAAAQRLATISQRQLPMPVLRPSVRVLAGPNSPTSSSTATISFATAAATNVTCRLDGGGPAICSSPVTYGGLAVGQHSLTVTATSRAGSSTASYQWTVATPSTPIPLDVPGSWTLKFDDEFSGSSLDLHKWQPNWLAGNDTSITPPDNSNDLNCMDPAQVSEGGGVLTLSAVARQCRAANGVTYQYASGLINTYKSFNFTYGYLEARIYLPSTGGTFVNFPAFWADGRGSWPATGELDVMEVLGSCVGFHFHSSLGSFGGCPAQGLTPGWHTFGANWQPGSVTYYYDGQRVGQVTSGVTGCPMYLILNNSVDPTWGGPTMTPAAMQIDYVRIWQ